VGGNISYYWLISFDEAGLRFIQTSLCRRWYSPVAGKPWKVNPHMIRRSEEDTIASAIYWSVAYYNYAAQLYHKLGLLLRLFSINSTWPITSRNAWYCRFVTCMLGWYPNAHCQLLSFYSLYFRYDLDYLHSNCIDSVFRWYQKRHDFSMMRKTTVNESFITTCLHCCLLLMASVTSPSECHTCM